MRTENLDLVAGRLLDVCRVTAPGGLLPELQRFFAASGLAAGIIRRDTPAIFDWFARVLNFQGVSNGIAAAYLDQHGTISSGDVAAALAAKPSCPKLESYWHFHDCRFAKVGYSCAEPAHLRACPLPTHDLRNGRLSQAAYALFLFVRDICGGDLVEWLDDRLAMAAAVSGPHRGAGLRNAVLDPLTAVFGVSAKVLSLALSDLLLGGDPGRPLWVETGASMVVVDTLVHNWLHRAGCLHDLAAEHAYGPGCYAPGGCADVIAAAAERIDARQFCPGGPTVFPRLVQRAVWLFCAAEGHDACNGNRIDDARPCAQGECPVTTCRRVPLR
ncbi:hypothetical protein P7D22_03860 [Lichenihabitans sp. Uapishka_5]|uniref:hypothetical protein n=1 Tax=Lichenihabitans sp. Uapishka_5 TaxID=3037302 RepID=UPI0029E7D1A8|nr:hypothetical protein [Lichenihabitans sp. Uapishka_5]MDX7950315.1 hypothetical protein [Lichenihabitans sp. Uapishka_5]